MTWVYEQSTGCLITPDGQVIHAGYAGGNCGKNPEGVNNPDMQEVHSVGPLPVGEYTFGIPLPASHLGPFAIPLVPDPDNEMFGRDGFFMHGDSVTKPGSASEGCIIMPRNVREMCWFSKDHKLNVVRG